MSRGTALPLSAPLLMNTNHTSRVESLDCFFAEAHGLLFLGIQSIYGLNLVVPLLGETQEVREEPLQQKSYEWKHKALERMKNWKLVTVILKEAFRSSIKLTSKRQS